jgi:hypothetical protein
MDAVGSDRADDSTDTAREDYGTLLQRYHRAHELAQRAPLGSMEYRNAMKAVQGAYAALAACAVVDEADLPDDEPF